MVDYFDAGEAEIQRQTVFKLAKDTLPSERDLLLTAFRQAASGEHLELPADLIAILDDANDDSQIPRLTAWIAATDISNFDILISVMRIVIRMSKEQGIPHRGRRQPDMQEIFLKKPSSQLKQKILDSINGEFTQMKKLLEHLATVDEGARAYILAKAFTVALNIQNGVFIKPSPLYRLVVNKEGSYVIVTDCTPNGEKAPLKVDMTKFKKILPIFGREFTNKLCENFDPSVYNIDLKVFADLVLEWISDIEKNFNPEHVTDRDFREYLVYSSLVTNLKKYIEIKTGQGVAVPEANTSTTKPSRGGKDALSSTADAMPLDSGMAEERRRNLERSAGARTVEESGRPGPDMNFRNSVATFLGRPSKKTESSGK